MRTTRKKQIETREEAEKAKRDKTRERKIRIQLHDVIYWKHPESKKYGHTLANCKSWTIYDTTVEEMHKLITEAVNSEVRHKAEIADLIAVCENLKTQLLRSDSVIKSADHDPGRLSDAYQAINQAQEVIKKLGEHTQGMSVTGSKEELKELLDAVNFAITFDEDERELHPAEAEQLDPDRILPKWQKLLKEQIPAEKPRLTDKF